MTMVPQVPRVLPFEKQVENGEESHDEFGGVVNECTSPVRILFNHTTLRLSFSFSSPPAGLRVTIQRDVNRQQAEEERCDSTC